MKRVILFSFLGILVFTSCSYIGGKRVHGNGNVISQNRNANNFNAVEVSGAINVYLKQDSARSVRVETDENLQELVEVFEENGMLHISPRNNFNLNPTNKTIKVFVSGPLFRALRVSGASNMYGENKLTSTETLKIDLTGASELKLDAKAPTIDMELTGASHVMLTGETKDFKIGGSGASEIKAFDLKTENAIIDVSGACSAELFASVKLDVHASGASEIRYKGAAAVSQDVNGASSIRKVE